MTAIPDHYATLGVEKGASQDDITKAYRKLAREYHPDFNKKPEAEERFKAVNEAYETLKDPQARARYDSMREGGFGGFGGFPGFGGFGTGPGGRVYVRTSGGVGPEIFEQIFGGDVFGDLFGGRARPAGPRRGDDVEASLDVSLAEAFAGTTKTVQMRDADGRPRRLEIRIPAGIRHGMRIRLAGQGEPGRMGGPPGDMYVRIGVADDPRFSLVNDDDVHMKLDVTPWDAALGASVETECLDGPLTVDVAAGSSSGKLMRVRGKGWPARGGRRGDLYVELRVVVPEKLSKDERRLFEELRKASSLKSGRVDGTDNDET